jgi:hypothetical protein
VYEAAGRRPFRPLDGLGGLVVQSDVAKQLAAEVGGRSEDAAGDDVALDLAKPELDLILPAGVSGREVKMDILVKAQELTRLVLWAERLSRMI